MEKNRMSNRVLMEKFIEFCNTHLGIENPCIIRLTKDRGVNGIVTTAYYDIINCVICVYIKDRAIMDIMRSVAHEIVHHHQNERGDLMGSPEDGADGSPLENEANAKAGEMIRIFGKQNPEIYKNNK